MEEVIITGIYTNIIEYYQSQPQEEAVFDNIQDSVMIVNGEKIIFREEDLNKWYFDRLFDSDCAYVEKFDEDTMRRYLSKHFSYLMKNVFYIELKLFKAKGSKGSFYIYFKDSPIIKEILLRSVSDNKRDIIIRKWLDGKIEDYSYHEIVELSSRLFEIINRLDDVDPNVKEQWITALSYALRSDLAYTMIEVEFTLLSVFSNSFPFTFGTNKETKDGIITHNQISASIINCANSLGEKAQNLTHAMVFDYLESINFEMILKEKTLPPIELLKLKWVCEYVCANSYIKEIIENSEVIDRAIDYFVSIDKELANKVKRTKELDKQRYQHKKQGKPCR